MLVKSSWEVRVFRIGAAAKGGTVCVITGDLEDSGQQAKQATLSTKSSRVVGIHAFTGSRVICGICPRSFNPGA